MSNNITIINVTSSDAHIVVTPTAGLFSLALANVVVTSGSTMSGDLEFSGTAALEVADNAYAFKAKTDNDAGIVFNTTDISVDSMSTIAAANAKCYVESGITRQGGKRASADFSKTADTTIALVTGLSVALVASKKYKYKAVLFINADATGGSKFMVGNLDTLTAANIIQESTLLDDSTSALVISTRVTALGTTVSNAGTTAGMAIIEGLIEVTNAGTFGVGFAQSVANGTSTVLRGSSFTIEEIL